MGQVANRVTEITKQISPSFGPYVPLLLANMDQTGKPEKVVSEVKEDLEKASQTDRTAELDKSSKYKL